MSLPLNPPSFWVDGTDPEQPWNDNALRQLISQASVNNSTTAQPALTSPADDGKCYIIQSTHTGAQWATFTPKSIAVFYGGNWYEFTPTEGYRISVGSTPYIYSSGNWIATTAAANRAPAIQSVTSSATVTPTFDDDMVKITAQAANLTLANPTGTAIPGLGMVIRIKDNGTARTITYGSQYRAIGVTLPATTVISKTLYLCMIFNSDDTRWDVVSAGQEA